jgi:O-antigen ligase
VPSEPAARRLYTAGAVKRRPSSRANRAASSRPGAAPSRTGATRIAPSKPGAARATAPAVSAAGTAPAKLASLLLWLLVLVPPLYISPAAKDPFRLPKLMLAEWLAIAALASLAWGLRRAEAVRWGDLWRQPAFRAVLPLLAVATAGLAATRHPLHVREALADLWIGAVCLVGWSVALPEDRLRRLLGGLLWPGVALAAIAILQFHGWQPLAIGGVRAGSRYALTSTAGNPGDLAAFLVLPCLVAQWRLARGGRPSGAMGRRAWLVAALLACAYAMALTQTVAALAALALGSLIFWGGVLGAGLAGRRRAVAGAAFAVLILLAAGVAAVLPPLRARVLEKVHQATRGDWNSVLTGRLDGWRAAAWMLGQHPWAGVGQGAYRAEFVPAKLALLARGAVFLSGQQQNFANAHDEPLEVAADCGWPGLLALGWAVWIVAGSLRARRRLTPEPNGVGEEPPARRLPAAGEPGAAGWRAAHADRAFAAAGVAALGVLCLVDFPVRVALVAFPALLFLSWVLRPAAAEAAA